MGVFTSAKERGFLESSTTEVLCLLVLMVLFSKGLVYLFLVCSLSMAVMVVFLFNYFDSWFLILGSYLFFGGIMCVLAYFSSFSFSSLRISVSPTLGLFFPLFGGGFFLSSRFSGEGFSEIGLSWGGTELLIFVCCCVLFTVMFFFLSVSKESWGGLRVFSL